MKCPDCDGGKKWTRVIDPPGWYDELCSTCHHGWLPFWTPAERAGLKAMGRLRIELSELAGWNDEEKAAGEAIVRYVAASRKAKEVPSEKDGQGVGGVE